MLKTVKELNNRYANANVEVRRIRASGGYHGATKSLDLMSYLTSYWKVRQDN